MAWLTVSGDGYLVLMMANQSNHFGGGLTILHDSRLMSIVQTHIKENGKILIAIPRDMPFVKSPVQVSPESLYGPYMDEDFEFD